MCHQTFIQNSGYYRSPPVRMTTASGSKLCTPTLDESGVTSTMAHSGVLHQHHKLLLNVVAHQIHEE